MLKKVYNKGLQLTDLAISKLHLFLEKTGIIKKIEPTIFKKIENTVLVKHPYPVNYNEKDKALFEPYINYTTHNETIYQFKNINISERGVIFKKLNNSGSSFPNTVFRAQYGWLYILKNYLFYKKITADKTKIYILLYDFWSAGNYYHWLIDAMPRLLSVKDLLKQKEYSLLLPDNCPKFVRQSLEYFDVNNITVIKKNEYLYTEKVLLPYYLAGSGRIHPTKIFEIKQFFSDKIKALTSNGRIYVSRSRQKTRRIVNEQEITELVTSQGFKVIYFEDYSFIEQVEIAKNTRVLISSHGANLTNLMFMPENTNVLELIRFDKPNFCYWALASVSKVNYYYQLCQLAHKDHLLIDVELFKVNLQKVLNE